ncbi:MAG: hypothetical protein LBJ65_31520 [Burkholderia sp.]|jgi:hypothetical protein|uniref:hypothetical protein n=1 Tax=Burkholderia sp. TaxID=36773 RepID=UPI0028398B93|nr:hypothetical protein [Burkholderia sp.]MDR0246145.1 hypothetical protein [Burkholderia sp.]
MAHSTIVFKQPNFGTIKSAPVGFSWTTMFFGFFPALFRGDFKWAAINFFVSSAVALLTFGIGGPVCWIVFALIYNKMYIRDLAGKGYLVDRVESRFTVDQLQAQLETVLRPAQAA